MPTYSAKPADVARKWYLVDASETSLGRVATQIATLLTGKNKAMYTAHIDCGDFVVVINADKLKVTGGKETKKVYYNHSGFPSGLRERQLKDLMSNDSTEVIRKAVRGMLPVNKLRDGRLKRLKVYAGAEHEHAAQKPEAISVKGAK
ncbi:50S ribosomal protein L13 [Candidatus Saccharibacteria bacterium]|nr:MAG: 50S ribosomal protein L13 [Candidatus Saccharibacteria bacterium]PID99338.1 MAG: 50S ribosomal protein L13 [Candidatus Saccharibacteria bacterium]